MNIKNILDTAVWHTNSNYYNNSDKCDCYGLSLLNARSNYHDRRKLKFNKKRIMRYRPDRRLVLMCMLYRNFLWKDSFNIKGNYERISGFVKQFPKVEIISPEEISEMLFSITLSNDSKQCLLSQDFIDKYNRSYRSFSKIIKYLKTPINKIEKIIKNKKEKP